MVRVGGGRLGVLLAASLAAVAVQGNDGISQFRQVRKATGVQSIATFTSNLTAGLAFTGCNDEYGCELYFYDFYNEPVLVKDIEAGIGHSSPTEFKSNGSSLLYFAASTAATGQELFKWDGSKGMTSGAVSLVYDLNLGPTPSYPSQLCFLNGLLYFRAFLGPSVGTELAVYDPNVQDPLPPISMVEDINRGSLSSNPSSLTAFEGKLFFQADKAGVGVELFTYDPATMTVTLIIDLLPGVLGSYPTWFTPFNGKLYFQAIGQWVGGELYKYDSTLPVGQRVVLVADIDTGNKTLIPNSSEPAASYPAELTPWGTSKLFFFAQTEKNGSELYVMQASNEAVSIVTDLYPGPTSSDPRALTVFGGGIYFAATTEAYGSEVWFLNLTSGAPGPYSTSSPGIPLPVLAADVNYGPSGSAPNYLTVANNNRYLYFSGFNLTAGMGLWQMTDPSLAGAPLPSSTPTPTPTPTITPTYSRTPNATSSDTPTFTPSVTETRTASATVNASMSWTMAPSQSRTATRTASESSSNTETASQSPTATESATASKTGTRSQTPSNTATETITRTVSKSLSATSTVTASPSPSGTVPPKPSMSASPTALLGVGANAVVQAGEGGPSVDSYALAVGLSVTFSIVGAVICAYAFYCCYWKPKMAAEDAAERAELRKEEEEEHRNRRRNGGDDGDGDEESPAFAQAGGKKPFRKPRGSRTTPRNRPQRPIDDDDEYNGGYDERELGADHLAALESGGPSVVGMARRGGPAVRPMSSRMEFPASSNNAHNRPHSDALRGYASTSARTLVGAARSPSRSGRLLSSSRDLLAPAVSPERFGGAAGGAAGSRESRTLIVNPVLGVGGGVTPGGRRITAVARPPGVGGPQGRPTSAAISRGGNGNGVSMSPQQAQQLGYAFNRPTVAVQSPGGPVGGVNRPRGMDV